MTILDVKSEFDDIYDLRSCLTPKNANLFK